VSTSRRSKAQTADYRRGGKQIRRELLRVCWLAAFGVLEHGDPMPACDGRLVRCHLIPKQVIQRAGGKVWDRRAWVWGCGGPTGSGGHHGMLDVSRTLRLPRECLPPELEQFAYDLGLMYWLDREYGPRERAA
jgi:hypothetical protein